MADLGDIIVHIFTENQRKKFNLEEFYKNFLKKRKVLMYNTLSLEEQRVILHKGTEAPFSGKYENHFEKGIYACKQCNAPLYTSESKFHSGCGCPALMHAFKAQ